MSVCLCVHLVTLPLDMSPPAERSPAPWRPPTHPSLSYRPLLQKLKPMQERNDKCLQAIRVLVQKLERVGVDLPTEILQLLETE